MSVLNNRNTLEHYLGKVWLTRPKCSAASPGRLGINVCIETDGDFTAIDYIQLAPDGVYYHKDRVLGTLESDSFRQYIEKLVGPGGESERDLFHRVRDCYTACGDMDAVARALGLSKTRTRRILITEGMLTGELIENIAWLHDKGRGKDVGQIAEMLKISENTVLKNMAYGKP